MNVRDSIRQGESIENKVIKLFEEWGYVALKEKRKDCFRHWDIEVFDHKKSFNIEVKYDNISKRTGNIAIEYFNCRTGRASGIALSKSDFFVYVFPDIGMYIAPTSKFKHYVQENPYHRERKIKLGVGDGNANLYLFKRDQVIKDIFSRIDKANKWEVRKILYEL